MISALVQSSPLQPWPGRRYSKGACKPRLWWLPQSFTWSCCLPVWPSSELSSKPSQLCEQMAYSGPRREVWKGNPGFHCSRQWVWLEWRREEELSSQRLTQPKDSQKDNNRGFPSSAADKSLLTFRNRISHDQVVNQSRPTPSSSCTRSHHGIILSSSVKVCFTRTLQKVIYQWRKDLLIL